MQVLRGKSKGATGKELEQVDLLGTKPKLTSKANDTAKKAEKGKQKETTNPTAATRTKAASRKPVIFLCQPTEGENLEIQVSALLNHCCQIPQKQHH